MSILVYHGAADTVKNPLASYGRPDLDFGQGFYVTYIFYSLSESSTGSLQR